MVSPLPPLLENAILRFYPASAWVTDLETGLQVPAVSATATEFVAFIKPAVGSLGARKLVQPVVPGADIRVEALECYLIRPMDIPTQLAYQDGGQIERIDSNRRLKGTITEIKIDTRIPLVTRIVGRHLYLTVEWSEHGG